MGYYRVNYEEPEWLNLNKIYTSLSIPDRTHLLEESFSIAEAGLLSYTYVIEEFIFYVKFIFEIAHFLRIPLDLSKQLANETEYAPWSVASSKLKAINTYLKESKQSDDFKVVYCKTEIKRSKLVVFLGVC